MEAEVGGEGAAGKYYSMVILLFALLAGVFSGFIRSIPVRHGYRPAPLNHTWLIIVAFLPQVLAFYFPPTRASIPDWLAGMCLVSSQIGLLAFVWLNRKNPGLLVLGIGLAANLMVIATNRGLMPIAPDTVAALYPGLSPDDGLVGSQLGWSKNIVLPEIATNFSFLSDCITLPTWFPWQYAFSPGDVLISAGVFWLLWAGGARSVTSAVPKAWLRWNSKGAAE